LSTSSTKKQKLIIQDILASPEIYTRVANILKASYFDQEYERLVEFIHTYNEKYHAVPAMDVINSEFDVDIELSSKITKDRIESTCDTIEVFCKESAVKDAIYASLDHIEKQEMGKVLELITDAVQVSLQKDMGIDVYDEPEERLKGLIESFTTIPTLIEGIDGPLEGGLIRKQLTLFSANSGGGKSLMLQNIGNNYAMQGYHVLNLTLELEEEMVFLRLGAILSGENASNWVSHIPEISAGILAVRDRSNGGTHMVKNIPEGATALDIRAYLKFYEIEFNRVPDVLLVDYLDVMNPNGGINGQGVFEQDKQKSEQLRNILREYNMIGVTASQQNREALTMTTPTQGVIAGGISKVNTVDNYISLFMDETMELEGEMNTYFLKSRSSHAKGKSTILAYNPINLRIGNRKDGTNEGVMPKARRKKEDKEETKQVGVVTVDIDGLPGIEMPDAPVKLPPENLFEEEITEEVAKIEESVTVAFIDNIVTEEDAEQLISLVEDFG